MPKMTAQEQAALPASAFIFPDERELPLTNRATAYDALRAAKEETLSGNLARADKIRLEVLNRFNIGRSGAEVI